MIPATKNGDSSKPNWNAFLQWFGDRVIPATQRRFAVGQPYLLPSVVRGSGDPRDGQTAAYVALREGYLQWFGDRVIPATGCCPLIITPFASPSVVRGSGDPRDLIFRDIAEHTMSAFSGSGIG